MSSFALERLYFIAVECLKCPQNSTITQNELTFLILLRNKANNNSFIVGQDWNHTEHNHSTTIITEGWLHKIYLLDVLQVNFERNLFAAVQWIIIIYVQVSFTDVLLLAIWKNLHIAPAMMLCNQHRIKNMLSASNSPITWNFTFTNCGFNFSCNQCQPHYLMYTYYFLFVFKS